MTEPSSSAARMAEARPPVRISGARMWEVALPLTTPFEISGGVLTTRRSLIVEVRDADGVAGFGESAPFELPFYSSETVASARALLADVLLPRLVGRSFASAANVHALLVEGIRENPFARAGAETAVWDLFAAKWGVTLLDLMSAELARLGVPPKLRVARPRIDCGVALGIPTGENAETLRRWTRDAVRRGYQRVKIKIRPGWDLVPIRAARAGLADEGVALPLWADANGAYDLRRDAAALRAVDEEELLFIEQPLAHDDLCDHAELARTIRTPICLDESLRDARWARHALELGASTIWNVKVQRLGGIAEALRVYALAVEHDVSLWGGTMPETGIGSRAILALGALSGFVYASDAEPSERWYGRAADLIELTMRDDGTMDVPSERGVESLGVRERLERVGKVVYDCREEGGGRREEGDRGAGSGERGAGSDR